MPSSPRPVERSRLIEARLQAHWALQPVGASGAALLEPEDDWSHTSVTWSGGVLRSRSGAGLRIADLTLLWHASELRLHGRTLAGALDWLAGRAGKRIELLDHEIPDHGVAEEARFDAGDAEALGALAAWYGMAARILGDVRQRTPGASPVRCWPHHFDIASLVDLDGDGSRTIGAGLSTGDDGCAEPYWYVSPWPYPAELPDLEPPGRWHTEGWTGAMLTASELFAAEGDPDTVSRAFVERAMLAARRALG